jgi:hypothetical protein
LSLAFDRGPLRPLRGSAFGLGQPDRFATGAFLDNHEIAFGVARFALRRISWHFPLSVIFRLKKK